MTTERSGPATPVPEPIEELAAERRTRSPSDAQRPAPGTNRVRLAWMVAIGADFLQMVAFPLFWWGAASPLDGVLDVVVGAILIRLLGWHWAFLPTVIAELVPGLDVIPTWTAAVFLVTRPRRAQGR